MSLDSWFQLSEVIDTRRGHVLLLRGRTKSGGENVVLKCYVCDAYAENAEHFVRWQMLSYESRVYEHTVKKKLQASKRSRNSLGNFFLSHPPSRVKIIIGIKKQFSAL